VSHQTFAAPPVHPSAVRLQAEQGFGVARDIRLNAVRGAGRGHHCTGAYGYTEVAVWVAAGHQLQLRLPEQDSGIDFAPTWPIGSIWLLAPTSK
jgi:hypothetical protein